MMESKLLTHSFVEIQLPLKFVKDALIQIEENENVAVEKRGFFPTLEHQDGEKLREVNISFMNMKSHLKVTFDKIIFSVSDGLHKCKIDSAEKEESDEVTKSNEASCVQHSYELNRRVETSPVQQENLDTEHLSEMCVPTKTEITKRKRGRPKKSNRKNSDIKDTESVSENRDVSKLADIQSMDKADTDTINPDTDNINVLQTDSENARMDSTNNGKRYSLRGRKLNSTVMALEKGSTGDGNDSEDETYSASESYSDNEITPFKKKIDRKEDNTASKENKLYARKIKEKVKEILSKGNISETIKHFRGRFINCKFCDKKLSGYNIAYKHVLKMHKKTTGKDEYIKEILTLRECSCCFCGKTLKDSSSLKKHQEDFHKDADFSCPLCDSKSKTLSNLKMHIRYMHVEVGKKAFCHLCAASFRSHGSLRQHIDLNHFGNKHVSCETCNKQFYNKSQLNRHMRAHNSDLSKQFKCEICGKTFNFEYNLKRHINVIHQPQSEKFHCSYCGKGFSQKVPMISHVQHIHFNLFPYSCKECKNSFQKAPLLKEHMMSVHHIADFEVPVMPKNSVYDKTDEDKFYCSYCSESFSHKIRLIEHMHGDHSDAFPFKCDICVQGFIEGPFLVQHMLKAHGVLLQNEEVQQQSEPVGGIMQIITTRNGYPNKVMSAISGAEILPDNEETFQEVQDETVNDGTYTQVVSTTDLVENSPPGTLQSSSSLVVEVARGSNTYQYVIEAPESIGQSGSEFAVQDIANILMAAEKSSQEDQVEVVESEPSTVQEISLVIDDKDLSSKMSTENQAQAVQFLLGQNDQNISLMSADNQGQPMEVVIDQNEQSSAVFTIENQAHSLQIEHGDIIELNDSNSEDGKNYYRIINVLDNQ